MFLIKSLMLMLLIFLFGLIFLLMFFGTSIVSLVLSAFGKNKNKVKIKFPYQNQPFPENQSSVVKAEFKVLKKD